MLRVMNVTKQTAAVMASAVEDQALLARRVR